MLTVKWWAKWRAFALVLILSITNGVAAVESGFPESASLASNIQSALNPVVGEGNYRLQLTVSPTGGSGSERLDKLVLVLNSQSDSANSVQKDELLALLSWATGQALTRQQIFISRVPFDGQDNGVIPSSLPVGKNGFMLLLAVLLAGILWRLRASQRAGQDNRLMENRVWQNREKETDYHRELSLLNQMAYEDSARVAQVLKQWVNAGEK